MRRKRHKTKLQKIVIYIDVVYQRKMKSHEIYVIVGIIGLMISFTLMMLFHMTIDAYLKHQESLIVDRCRVKYEIPNMEQPTYVCDNANGTQYIIYDDELYGDAETNMYIERPMKHMRGGRWK